jgi:hypothetical protein
MADSFSPDIATRLINERPGRSAEEIVGDALDRGIIKTTGRDRMAGQIGALAKMYNNGRLPEITRDQHQRPFRYYPKGAKVISPQPKALSEPVTFRPTPEQEAVLTALIETRKFSNRSDAVSWLLDQGIASNKSSIDKIVQAFREIQQLRRQVQQIDPLSR